MFCSSGLVFGGTEGDGSRFHVLRSLTHFRSARTALRLAFMLSAPEYLFGGTEGVGSSFHVLRCRTSFSRYRGRRVPF
jgi:hypothetical protein